MDIKLMKELTEYMRTAGVESFSYEGLAVKFASDWSAAPISFGDNTGDDDKRSKQYQDALSTIQDLDVSEEELMAWSVG